jgi:pyrimidine operon attenuation protein/uracil phosphoribosyltransferase
MKNNIIMNSEEIDRAIKRMAHEIIEKNKGTKNLAIIGIQTTGVYLASRLAEQIGKIESQKIPVGVLDITLYRDDVGTIAHQPLVKETNIPFNINNRIIILVDDVLFAGRTVRAALDEIIDFGRPKAIRLAVLVDRGHRELPIRADFVGLKITTTMNDTVIVELKESKKYDQDRVVIQRQSPMSCFTK